MPPPPSNKRSKCLAGDKTYCVLHTGSHRRSSGGTHSQQNCRQALRGGSRGRLNRYSRENIKSILNHIKGEWVIITTMDVASAKKEFNKSWDMTSQITKYIRELNKRATYCHLLRIDDINSNSKAQVFVESVYASDMFTDTEIDDWETAVDKSWAASQAYFIRLYKKKKTFTKQRANRRGGYNSANSVADQSIDHHFLPKTSSGSLPESILTSNTGMTLSEQQTMVTYAQELESKLEGKQTAFAAAMSTTQSTVMEQMQKQQKMMMDQQQKFMEAMMMKFADKCNVQSGDAHNNNQNDGDHYNNDWRKKYPKCPNCGKHGKHASEPDTCLVGEKQGQSPAGWKV